MEKTCGATTHTKKQKRIGDQNDRGFRRKNQGAFNRIAENTAGRRGHRFREQAQRAEQGNINIPAQSRIKKTGT